MRSVNVATGNAAAGYAFCGNGGRETVLMTLSFSKHRARVRLRDDPRPRRPEHEVAVGVVIVPMRVDREVDVLAAELANRGEIARHELRELRVDGQHAVRADGDGDVAAEPE